MSWKFNSKRAKVQQQKASLEFFRDNLEQKFASLGSLFKIQKLLQNLYDKTKDRYTFQQLQDTNKQVLQNIQQLTFAGVSLSDLYERYGSQLYKSQLIDAQKKIAEKESSSGSHHIEEIANLYPESRFAQSRVDPSSRDPIEQIIMLQAEYAENHRQKPIKLPSTLPSTQARYIESLNKETQNLAHFVQIGSQMEQYSRRNENFRKQQEVKIAKAKMFDEDHEIIEQLEQELADYEHDEEKKKNLALRLQALFRGKQGRLIAEQEKKKQDEEKKKQDEEKKKNLILRLQALFRGKQARSQTEKQIKEKLLEKAEIKEALESLPEFLEQLTEQQKQRRGSFKLAKESSQGQSVQEQTAQEQITEMLKDIKEEEKSEGQSQAQTQAQTEISREKQPIIITGINIDKDQSKNRQEIQKIIEQKVSQINEKYGEQFQKMLEGKKRIKFDAKNIKFQSNKEQVTPEKVLSYLRLNKGSKQDMQTLLDMQILQMVLYGTSPQDIRKKYNDMQEKINAE